MEDLCTENSETLMKEVEEDTNKWEDILCSWIGRINTGKPSLFCCALLYCASQVLHFLQIEGLWQSCVEQVCQNHFPTAFPYFMSQCHILIIFGIFQTFTLLYFLW